MSQAIYVVDAFADRPFTGNPAGVCPLQTSIPAELMQQIAMEMNHAETAFPCFESPGVYDLRWFTPAQEVPMCGHATLASAHVLWSTGKEQGRILFKTKSGDMTAEKIGSKIVLNFPAEFVKPVADLAPFETALQIPVRYVGDNWMFWLAELESEEAVRALQPDMTRIAALGREGIIVTAKSDSGADDFVSRLFAPNVGIPEDPVTGSAHCLLAPFWSGKLGKTEMVGYQASKRGGYVGVEFLGARVLLKGTAVTTLEAKLCI